MMVKMNSLIDKTTFVKKNFGSEHTPTMDTTRTLGEISKQNRAAHSDEEGNIINRFRSSNSTISCKLLSFDAGADDSRDIDEKRNPEEGHIGARLFTCAEEV